MEHKGESICILNTQAHGKKSICCKARAIPCPNRVFVKENDTYRSTLSSNAEMLLEGVNESIINMLTQNTG